MPVFVSIATASHVPLARAALASVAARGGASFQRVLYVVGAGDRRGAGGADPEIRHVEDHLTPSIIHQLVSRYTAPEVCFALKPYVIQSLLQGGANAVHYLDADVRFYADAAPLESSLAAADLVLTPHCLQPFPLDGRRPSAVTLLRAGSFNAGYVGVRNTPEALRFLQWWADIVLRHGENDSRIGMAGDQRWLDLVPALFPGCVVLRHPGANVGYWNLHERELSRTDGTFTSNGEPLLFFHFSGFLEQDPLRVSHYQDRVDASGNPALKDLLTAYARELASLERPAARYVYHRWWHDQRPPIPAIRRWLRKHMPAPVAGADHPPRTHP